MSHFVLPCMLFPIVDGASTLCGFVLRHLSPLPSNHHTVHFLILIWGTSFGLAQANIYWIISYTIFLYMLTFIFFRWINIWPFLIQKLSLFVLEHFPCNSHHLQPTNSVVKYVAEYTEELLVEPWLLGGQLGLLVFDVVSPQEPVVVDQVKLALVNPKLMYCHGALVWKAMWFKSHAEGFSVVLGWWINEGSVNFPHLDPWHIACPSTSGCLYWHHQSCSPKSKLCVSTPCLPQSLCLSLLLPASLSLSLCLSPPLNSPSVSPPTPPLSPSGCWTRIWTLSSSYPY